MSKSSAVVAVVAMIGAVILIYVTQQSISLSGQVGELQATTQIISEENRILFRENNQLGYQLDASRSSLERLEQRTYGLEDDLSRRVVEDDFGRDPVGFTGRVVTLLHTPGFSYFGDHPGFLISAILNMIEVDTQVSAREEFKRRWSDIQNLRGDWEAIRPSLTVVLTGLSGMVDLPAMLEYARHCPALGIATEDVVRQVVQDDYGVEGYCVAFLRLRYRDVLSLGKSEPEAVALIDYVREEIIPGARRSLAFIVYLEKVASSLNEASPGNVLIWLSGGYANQ